MWLSKRSAEVPGERSAQMGGVTIGGGNVAVYTDMEQRGLELLSPGGYMWRPKVGQDVLVIKCGGESVIAGARQSETPSEFMAGEVYIKSDGGAAVYLKNDGTIAFSGDAVINGTLSVQGRLFVNGNEIS